MSSRVAVITGAGSGIGAATARRLAEDGLDVVVTDLPQVIDSIDPTDLHPRCHLFPLDVGDADGREALVGFVGERFSRVDVLFNCAGVGPNARLSKISDEDMAFALGINLLGPISLTRQLVPLMIESGGGAIINVSSRAWLGIFGSGIYTMSKGGLVGFSRALALELGAHGITVNAIAPGYIETPLAHTLPAGVLAETMEAIPVRRGGKPEDIASAVSYLVNEGSYVTGQTLAVCGGRSISG
ncbi:SDR family oxidoreductase [Aeromicrobium sp. YIM 150415]|uniref:SDR family NAD(P)-dependent oxidoreductase n=1 Tax=Aeromicrobium sp. YIM 150415 TaxID=2803912 RepID=UPI001962D41D|nr:SDR family oxidoreductase [Aeromicrobium sp. YIM 150415]MBM9464395.1 SDR family oxidoreductase [Aeromicrobium sp. YIM 150415]